VAHEWHPLDEELTEAEEGGAQPRRHEHTDQEDEADGGDKPETCTAQRWPSCMHASVIL